MSEFLLVLTSSSPFNPFFIDSCIGMTPDHDIGIMSPWYTDKMYSNNDDCFIMLVTKSALISRPSENAPQAFIGQALPGPAGGA